MTLSLFTRHRYTWDDLSDDDTDPDGARYYQRAAVDAFHAKWKEHDSLLCVMATGLGKSHVQCVLVKHWRNGAVLIVVPTLPLLDQMRQNLEQMIPGAYIDIEQADYRSSHNSRIVLASMASLQQQERLDRMGRDRFGLLLFDEAHLSLSPGGRRILQHFRCKKGGFTATPDRADEKAMGLEWDDVAYCMDIEDGIDAGYLVPLRTFGVKVDEIDLDKVRTGATGDFIETELDEAIYKGVGGIVHKTLELHPNRRGICFFPGRRSAALATEVFNRARPGCAVYIDGETEPHVRRQAVADFRSGRYQYLCNCDVASIGFDAPPTDLIVQGSPTKSRAKYAQRVGRGTRILSGLVENLPGPELAAARRAAIASSKKPNLVVLDFCGGGEVQHGLASVEDVLGGNYTEEEVEHAKKKRNEAGGEGDSQQFLKDARKELAALAASRKVKAVKAVVREHDPFRVLNVGISDEARAGARFGDQPPTERQAAVLKKFGVEDVDIGGMTKRTASKLLGTLIERAQKGLATYRQQRQLQKYGITDQAIPIERAKAAMNYLRQKRFVDIDPLAIHEILYGRRREPGE